MANSDFESPVVEAENRNFIKIEPYSGNEYSVLSDVCVPAEQKIHSFAA